MSPLSEELFVPVDGRVVIRAMPQGDARLSHIEVETVETVRGQITSRPVKWALTAFGARKLAAALKRAARIAERGYATAAELRAVAGEED